MLELIFTEQIYNQNICLHQDGTLRSVWGAIKRRDEVEGFAGGLCETELRIKNIYLLPDEQRLIGDGTDINWNAVTAYISLNGIKQLVCR